MRRFASNAIVVVLVAYAIANLVSAASAFWSVPGTFGLTADYGATVRAVVPGGPADRAGIVAGDRIALGATPFDERRFVAGANEPVESGAIVDVRVLGHDATADRNVRLVAVAAPLQLTDRWTLLIVCCASLVFIVIGAALIVMRPSPATWGFGLYCLLVLPVAGIPLRLSSAASATAATLIYDIVQNFGVAGLLLFALEFPRSFATVWRERIRRALPALFVVLALLTLYPDVFNLFLGRGAQTENRILQVLFGVLCVLAIAILVDTYRRIAVDERERVRWVLIGFCFGLLTNYLGNTFLFSTLLAVNPPVWVVNALISLNVLLPLTVAHAVVRHRVLDINFVIGRALIFTVLTTALAGVFGILDWLFGSFLEDFRLTRVLAAAVSITVAFTFSRIEHRALKWVEAVFFRKRRAAAAHIERSIRALPHARTADVIDNAVVADVTSTLEIASAAVFRSSTGGGFLRMAAFGWAAGDCAALDDTDRLVLLMRSERRPLVVDEIPWSRTDVPAGGYAPYIAVPMLSHADLAGFIVYGAHPDGSRLDPDEVAELERLALAAGVAFGQLDAQQMRADNEALRASNADLLARLDEVRRAQRL